MNIPAHLQFRENNKRAASTLIILVFLILPIFQHAQFTYKGNEPDVKIVVVKPYWRFYFQLESENAEDSVLKINLPHWTGPDTTEVAIDWKIDGVPIKGVDTAQSGKNKYYFELFAKLPNEGKYTGVFNWETGNKKNSRIFEITRIVLHMQVQHLKY